MDIKTARTRIEALLRKAESTTEAEAFLLYEKAQELMTKYRVEQAMLNLDRDNTDEKMVAIHIPYHTGTPGSSALGSLVVALTKANHCVGSYLRLYGNKDANRAFRVFGYESDVAMVESLYNSIVIQLVVAYKNALKSRPPHIHPRTFRQSYTEGYVTRIRETLKERARATVADASEEVGLVLVARRDRVIDASGVRHPNGVQRRTKYSAEAHKRGFRDGGNVNMGDKAIRPTKALN